MYRFAESDEPITVDGDTWAVVPGLQISAVKHTNNGEMPSAQIIAVHNRGTVFDTNDIDVGLFDAATVQIYIVDRMNLAPQRTAVHRLDRQHHLQCRESGDVRRQGAAAFAKILMTQKRSPMCRTDLFSVLCGVDRTAMTLRPRSAAMLDAFNFTVGAWRKPMAGSTRACC